VDRGGVARGCVHVRRRMVATEEALMLIKDARDVWGSVYGPLLAPDENNDLVHVSWPDDRCVPPCVTRWPTRAGLPMCSCGKGCS
jgi:hypothetical protein